MCINKQEVIKILIIEDNLGDLELIKMGLEKCDTEIKYDSVSDGESAIEYLSTKRDTLPKFIIIDINLPKMNGHEVLSYIKSTDFLKNIPVTVFTTSDSDTDIEKAYSNFANVYFTKPVSANEFLELVKKIGNFWSNEVKLPSV